MSNPHHTTSITQDAVANATISVAGSENTFDNVDNFASAENTIVSDTGGKHGAGAATWTDDGEQGAAVWQNADAEATIVVVGDKNKFQDVTNLASANNEVAFLDGSGNAAQRLELIQDALAEANIVVQGNKNHFNDVANIANARNDVSVSQDNARGKHDEGTSIDLEQLADASAVIYVIGDKNKFQDVVNQATAENDAGLSF